MENYAAFLSGLALTRINRGVNEAEGLKIFLPFPAHKKKSPYFYIKHCFSWSDLLKFLFCYGPSLHFADWLNTYVPDLLAKSMHACVFSDFKRLNPKIKSNRINNLLLGLGLCPIKVQRFLSEGKLLLQLL